MRYIFVIMASHNKRFGSHILFLLEKGISFIILVYSLLAFVVFWNSNKYFRNPRTLLENGNSVGVTATSGYNLRERHMGIGLNKIIGRWNFWGSFFPHEFNGFISCVRDNCPMFLLEDVMRV